MKLMSSNLFLHRFILAVGSGDYTSSGYDTQISPSTSDYTSHTATDNQSEDTTNEVTTPFFYSNSTKIS